MKNREHREAFRSDIERTINLVATVPGVSSAYSRMPGVRRVFVERLGVHVYFTFEFRVHDVRDQIIGAGAAIRGGEPDHLTQRA